MVGKYKGKDNNFNALRLKIQFNSPFSKYYGQKYSFVRLSEASDFGNQLKSALNLHLIGTNKVVIGH